jgi:hypothetical protein
MPDRAQAPALRTPAATAVRRSPRYAADLLLRPRLGVQVACLPVDKDARLARIAHRQASAPHQAFPVTGAGGLPVSRLAAR